MKKTILLAACMTLFVPAGAHAARLCGDLKNAFGPFDYRKASQLTNEFNLVESAHFTPEVEQNMRGNTGYLAADIDYTLRAWPNHHRALASMSRQGILEKTVQPRGAHYPVDCYFLRAFEFAPTDGMVHAVYANHLFAHGKADEALAEFKRAAELEPNNPTINYNAGLALLRVKDYDRALVYAQKAYAQKFPLPALKNKLVEAGKWVEPPPPAPEAADDDKDPAPTPAQ